MYQNPLRSHFILLEYADNTKIWFSGPKNRMEKNKKFCVSSQKREDNPQDRDEEGT